MDTWIIDTKIRIQPERQISGLIYKARATAVFLFESLEGVVSL